MRPLVRHNLRTDRVITACPCGRTVSMPRSGLSDQTCPCGRVWACDGDKLEMYEPKDWGKRN